MTIRGRPSMPSGLSTSRRSMSTMPSQERAAGVVRSMPRSKRRGIRGCRPSSLPRWSSSAVRRTQTMSWGLPSCQRMARCSVGAGTEASWGVEMICSRPQAIWADPASGIWTR
ncbi:hypothetical protein SALBM311S_10867 [Streptomyces alboniger]